MNIEQLMPDIEAAARTVAYKWPSVTSKDDMTNDIVVNLLESPRSISVLLSMEVPARRSSLVRIGHKIAAAERDDFEVFSGRYLYSVEEVKRLLSQDALGTGNKFHPSGQDVLEGMIELERRNSNHAKAIITRYADGVIPDRKSKEKDVLNRAIEALTLLMNRSKQSKQYEYSNGGRHRNNRQSIAYVETEYNGVEEV